MADDLAAPGHARWQLGSDPIRSRYIVAVGLGYFLACQLGGPLIHYAVNPAVTYWLDPLAVLAHGLGAFGLVALLIAREADVLAAHVVVWSTWVAVWVAVLGTLGTPHGDGVSLYLAIAPLVAGLLLAARHVVMVGGLNIFGAAVLGGTAAVAPASAMNAALLTIAATLVLGVSAYTRHVDQVVIGGQARQLITRTAELEAIMQAASDGMVAIDPAGRIVDANPAALRLTGADALPRGLPLSGILSAELMGLIEPLTADPERESAHVELPGPPRLRIAVQAFDGPREGYLITLQDVTEEREAEAQRRLADLHGAEVEKLRELNRFKANLLNAASHELNTPLTPVRLQVELLRSTDRGPLNDRQAHSLDILDRNIRRLSALIGDILDVAKLDGARLPLRCVPVALDTLVRDEAAGFQDNARRAGLALDVEVDGQAWVWGDPARLGQVLSNLVSNGIKFTKEGRVRVHCGIDAGWATVTVEDTGVGVPREAETSLFEPFGQLHKVAHDVEGAGMGLYMSKGIVEAHGGQLGFERRDPGSSFWFRIPIDVMDAEPPRHLTPN